VSEPGERKGAPTGDRRAPGEPRELLGALTGDVRSSWHRFLDVFEPLRPELYRYCRYLTRSAWDAEDLVQDALMRGFVTLGTVFRELPNPRAWLFRVASNLWIDRVRRAKADAAAHARAGAPPHGPQAPAGAPAAGQPDRRESREAAGALLVRLAPQERAAVVLKDVFDFSLDEIAETLVTTVGAVKAALHRGRGKLAEPEDPPERLPAPGALDAFCAAFNARDLDGLTDLLLDGATVEIVGVVTEYGPDDPKDPRTGSFAGSLAPITSDERGGIAPELMAGYLGGTARCEVRPYRDGWVLLFWYEHDQGPMVRGVMTVDPEGDLISRVRNYFFTPDVIAEVCAEVGVPYRVNGYRYW
jgi:RNA polymerase sigma-70 factor, ECF subfamily